MSPENGSVVVQEFRTDRTDLRRSSHVLSEELLAQKRWVQDARVNDHLSIEDPSMDQLKSRSKEMGTSLRLFDQLFSFPSRTLQKSSGKVMKEKILRWHLQRKRADIEVPSESFHRSSLDSSGNPKRT